MSNVKLLGLFIIVSFTMILSVNAQAETVTRDHRTKNVNKNISPRKPPPANTTDHRVNKNLPPAAAVTGKYLVQHPRNRQNGWSDGLQGVAHDQNNWFFTQKKRLWKFPISHDLNKKVDLSKPKPAGVKTMTIPESLKRGGYNSISVEPESYSFCFLG
jgi:hypothetical protein